MFQCVTMHTESYQAWVYAWLIWWSSTRYARIAQSQGILLPTNLLLLGFGVGGAAEIDAHSACGLTRTPNGEMGWYGGMVYMCPMSHHVGVSTCHLARNPTVAGRYTGFAVTLLVTHKSCSA